jgi:hypothetical protein
MSLVCFNIQASRTKSARLLSQKIEDIQMKESEQQLFDEATILQRQAAQLDAIEKQHSIQLAEIQKRQAAQIDAIEKQYNNQLKAMQNQQTMQIASLKKQHIAELEIMKHKRLSTSSPNEK